MANDWFQELTIELIPEPYATYARKIGIENLLKLSQIVGGDEVYIPTVDFFRRPLRDQKLRQEYNGYNHKQLARKYELSERRVREIVEHVKITAVDDNQTTLLIGDDGAFTWGTPSQKK